MPKKYKFYFEIIRTEGWFIGVGHEVVWVLMADIKHGFFLVQYVPYVMDLVVFMKLARYMFRTDKFVT